MPRGGKRPGAGRPPGAISKSTRAILEATASGGEMPLEYMLRIMRDPREPAACRDEMAKAAAPYLHPKMQSTAPSTDDGLPVCPSRKPDYHARASRFLHRRRGRKRECPAAAGADGLARQLQHHVFGAADGDRQPLRDRPAHRQFRDCLD